MKIRLLVVLLIAFSFISNAAAQSDVFDRKNIETRMLSVAKWQFANPNHALYDWTNGAFYAGVFAAYETTKSPDLMAAIMEMGEKNGWKPGPRFDHADDIAISQTYIDVYRIKKDKKMIQPTIDVVNRLKTEKGEQAAKNSTRPSRTAIRRKPISAMFADDVWCRAGRRAASRRRGGGD